MSLGYTRPRILQGFCPEIIEEEEEGYPGTSPPKIVRHRRYDGRVLTFVTEYTQTDWDWAVKAEQSGTARTSGTSRTREIPDSTASMANEIRTSFLEKSQLGELKQVAGDTDDSGDKLGNSSEICGFCKQGIKPLPSLAELENDPKLLYCCKEYRKFVEWALLLEFEPVKNTFSLINIEPHKPYGSKEGRKATKLKGWIDVESEKKMQTPPQTLMELQGFFRIPGCIVPMNLGGRNMTTVNYKLSSPEFEEKGWTLPIRFPTFNDSVYVPETLNPIMVVKGMLRDHALMEKYESGQKFRTIFPDGTGNVFYPSGNLAILISSVKLGQYYYTIHDDVVPSKVLAAFEPTGYGFCCFPDGDVRLYVDENGGIEFDNMGGKKRKWSWKDPGIRVLAPSFQQICIGLNRHLGLRVKGQGSISVTFSACKRSCRFNMGSKLKLVVPHLAPLQEVEEAHVFLEEKKNQVEALLNKVGNILKFPNHPKIDKMLPPLRIVGNQNKMEKMKKERLEFLAQQDMIRKEKLKLEMIRDKTNKTTRN